MIELDSVLIILMAEALVALLLLAVIFFVVMNKKRSKEQTAANDLINKLEANEISRSKILGERINESCEIDSDQLRGILKEINHSEHELYQQILQIFLKHDVALLKKIDRYVNKLSTPYCNILKDSAATADNSNDTELEQARAQISRLKSEGVQLSEQLQIAMQTMDQISAEYTRVFSGTQTEMELENSSKKMMRIFADAEKSIVKEVETEQL